MYSSHKAYSDSKLLVVAASNMLSQQLQNEGSPVSVCSIHPGIVRSNLWKHVSPVHRVPLSFLFEGWAYLVSMKYMLQLFIFPSLNRSFKGTHSQSLHDPSNFCSDFPQIHKIV